MASTLSSRAPQVTNAAKCTSRRLKSLGITYKLLQNVDSSWSLRFGPLTAIEAGKAFAAFVR
jgi:hypothetical protein